MIEEFSCKKHEDGVYAITSVATCCIAKCLWGRAFCKSLKKQYIFKLFEIKYKQNFQNFRLFFKIFMEPFKSDVTTKIAFFGLLSPLVTICHYFLLPPTHFIAQKMTNLSPEKPPINAFQCLYDASQHKLNHKQMAEEINEQSILFELQCAQGSTI